MNLPVIVIGAGGHAKVVIEALRQSGAAVMGCTGRDPAPTASQVSGVPMLGGDNVLDEYGTDDVLLANGVGSTGDTAARSDLFNRLSDRGYRFTTVVHPSAVVAGDAEIGEGTQIMAGAVVQPGCRFGVNTIVNTRAAIDHDGILGDHVHVAPGAVLSGTVTIGARSHVGTGAVIIQSVTVGTGCVVGAGAVVTRSVADGERVAGVPARTMTR